MYQSTAQFHWADYLVFACSLAISAGIGVFFAYKSRRHVLKDPEHHMTGDKKLQVFPVALSLTASFMSAIFVIGIPAEVYFNGANYWIGGIAYLPTVLVCSIFMLPMFRKLRLTCAYEYLEMRFNKAVRLMGSTLFIVQMAIYLGIVVYAPALALSQVTGLTIEFSILTVGLVSTFYTTIGGIKAVIWTDAFQMGIITAGMLTLIIQGAITVGGWEVVMERTNKGGRLPDFDWNPDPTIRHSFWSLFVGGFLSLLTIYGSNQAMLQRYVSTRTDTGSQVALWTSVVLAMIYLCMSCLTGLVLFAYYHDCDPLFSRRVSKPDQIVPLFMMDILSFAPGLPGLFVSCIFSAALSTVSSGINSLAAVTLIDFITPALNNCMSTKLTKSLLSKISLLLGQYKMTIVVCNIVMEIHVALFICTNCTVYLYKFPQYVNIALTVYDYSLRYVNIALTVYAYSFLYGGLTIGLAFLAGVAGKQVLQIAISIFGMMGGPLLALILVGMFLPFVNSWGAGIGLVCSTVTSLWVGIGAVLNPPPRHLLSLSIAGCVSNATSWNITTTTTTTFSMTTKVLSTQLPLTPPERSVLSDWYELSYLHYVTVAIIVFLVVSVVVSAATCFNRGRIVERRLYYSVFGCCSEEGETYDVNRNVQSENISMTTTDKFAYVNKGFN
ncbi:sodium-coupled monocarboxylate transporter 1-like [Gigantopelta aegis]|uniref:sodium-coupled monocarboxylate transporter 1-like n=1 Tax=Gigantopelta aegis TaxID=1735272 RepID=UPI001B88BCB2|nr:sodium-coupled monocarboxylate transporter 1-like [Gigantopelta aegis]